MGRRHLTGLAALAGTPHSTVRLVAVCDLNRHNAEDLAGEAEAQLGARPRVFADLAEMVRAMPEIQGADVTTDTATHHLVATACLELGLHVQCEKPLALTMRGGQKVLEAARRSGKLLSVAENFRRDPINRLARALIDAGAIGRPQLMVETSIGGGNAILITPWRHQKMGGTITLDAGVHNADIMQYYMGDALSAYGEGRLYEPLRYKTDDPGPGGFYAKWAAQVPDVVEATGEDALFGYISFQSGAVGQLIMHFGGHGLALHQRHVFGSAGSLVSPGDRNGRPLVLHLDGGRAISGPEILDYAPAYRLSPAAASLFGGERVWTYDFPFRVTDAKILALEYHEFGACIQAGTLPEVTGLVAQRDVALIYALFESGRLGRPVRLDETERLEVDAYQREMDERLGLL
jgi:predicted dehydrogenase